MIEKNPHKHLRDVNKISEQKIMYNITRRAIETKENSRDLLTLFLKKINF